MQQNPNPILSPQSSDIMSGEQEIQTSHRTTPPTRIGPFAVRHLYAVVTAVALAAGGLVSAEDILFVLFSIIYMYFLSKIAFPTVSPTREPPVFGLNNKVLNQYVFAAAIIGLFLPIAYIIEGIFVGDKEGSKLAAPHLFLLASQVFMEGLAWSDRFSLPIRVYVPVFYNSRRIFTLAEWVRAEIADELSRGGTWRLCFGRGLALANMGLWCFNLFGFLLPVYLPRAFKMYYSNYKVKD